MFERIKSLFSPQEEEYSVDPNAQISALLIELDAGIATADESIKEAKENEKNLKQNISILFVELDQVKKRAKRFLDIGNQSEAQKSFSRVQSLENQLTQYGKILADVENTIQEIEGQKAHFALKKNEISSKQLLYQVKIKGAQNQAAIQGNLMSSMNYDEFSSYENLLQEAHAKAEAIAEINNDFSSYREETYSSGNESIESFKKELDKEKQEKEEEVIRKEKEKIDALFSRMRTPQTPVKPVATDKKLEEAKKKKDINKFFEKSNTEEEKQKVNDFFNKKSDPKEDKLRDFFKDK